MPSLVDLTNPGRAVSVVRHSFPGSAGGYRSSRCESRGFGRFHGAAEECGVLLAGPGSGLRPLQDLQHGCEVLDQRGEHCLALLRGSQRRPTDYPVLRIVPHPGGQEMAPVVGYPVRL